MDYLPPMPRGRAATPEAVENALEPLTRLIMRERAKLRFSPTLRGWAYLLEGLGVCTKGDFDQVMSRIVMMRKRCILPLNITVADDTRSSSGGSWISNDLAGLMKDQLERLPYWYSTVTMEEFTGIHVELFVEKLDLVGLLSDITHEYKITVTCSRGWADLHSRARLLERCSEHRNNLVLCFADHDPGGLSISSSFKAGLEEVLPATGLETFPNIHFERAGLNSADIESFGLAWIEGLETSAGGDLSSPKHPQHSNAGVQRYLATYGPRKCEANALMRVPAAATQILQKTLDKHISRTAVKQYHEQREADRLYAKGKVDQAIQAMEAR